MVAHKPQILKIWVLCKSWFKEIAAINQCIRGKLVVLHNRFNLRKNYFESTMISGVPPNNVTNVQKNQL
jgi:hypothetical protein